MTSRAITSESFGAWVIKCNPRVTDIEPMVEARRATERWCVADNYRSRLMAAGQPVLFWVSAHPQRGIWGAGTLTGPAEPGPKWTVPTDIALFDEPVTAAALSALPELAGIEVFRSPQQSNPSWVDMEAWAVVRGLLPGA
jgi:hypothetical protein